MRGRILKEKNTKRVKMTGRSRIKRTTGRRGKERKIRTKERKRRRMKGRRENDN
jgi:hypothetical protein